MASERLAGARRIGLGTAQFGLDYGISNNAGQPSSTEVEGIIDAALQSGVAYLDTATSYGQAEEIVGRCLPAQHDLKIVTKISPIAASAVGRAERDAILESIARSMERLRAGRLYGVMVHRVSDLTKPGAEHVVEAMHEARARGWTGKIGASIYNDTDLAIAESVLAPELVQLPFNILDLRLVESGSLQRLAKKGVEVHARSVFLQGLLLMEPNTLPAFFAPIRDKLRLLYAEWDSLELGRLATCLAFVLQRPEIQCVVVGVNRLAELRGILDALAIVEKAPAISPSPAPIDPRFLDPSCWPSFR